MRVAAKHPSFRCEECGDYDRRVYGRGACDQCDDAALMWSGIESIADWLQRADPNGKHAATYTRMVKLIKALAIVHTPTTARVIQ